MPQSRIHAALALLERLDLDAILVVGMVNIRYLTGFTGSDGALVVTHDGCRLLCDSRYSLQAAEEACMCTVTEYRLKQEGIAALLGRAGRQRVAIDAEKVSVSLFNSLSSVLHEVEFVPLGDELDQLRAIKSPQEIDRIASAAELASTAFHELTPMIKSGVTERWLALELEFIMKRSGGEEKSFEFIVASGYRGALPHARPTVKQLQSGELVTLDFGVCIDGYNSDETVTVAVGRPDSRLLDIYAAVREAHDLALRAVKPGMVCSSLDSIAREHIKSCGFGDYFGHGLGHGVGLEIHEKPTISQRSMQVIEVGMVFTIEPGVYIPEIGGVRIEDLVLVTESGCEVLSKVGKELIYC